MLCSVVHARISINVYKMCMCDLTSYDSNTKEKNVPLQIWFGVC